MHTCYWAWQCSCFPPRYVDHPLYLPLQLHEEDDALNVWMYDAVENNGKYTRWQALAQLLTALGLMAGLYGLSVLYDAPSRNPAVSMAPQQQGAREYPAFLH